VKFPLTWPERLYGLVLLTYPRSFRRQYEHEMRLVFRDLLHDKGFSRWQLAQAVMADLVAGITARARLPTADLVKTSVFYGLLIVAFSMAARAWHPGQYLGVPMTSVPFLVFIFAGFWGARRTRSFAGGMWVAVIIGAVSSTMVLWDKLLFDDFPFPDLYTFSMSMLLTIGFCVGPAILGSIAGAATAPEEELAS
jgi:hypothetical protein